MEQLEPFCVQYQRETHQANGRHHRRHRSRCCWLSIRFDVAYRPVHLTRSSLDLVNLDDCWQVTRDAQGIIQADSTAFPSGIPALADYIHSRKLKFGLYSGIPFPFFPARLYLHLKHRCWLQDLRRPTRLARLRTERRQHLCFVDSRLSQVRQLQHRRVDPRSAISGDARCSERQWSLHILLYVWYVLALPSLCSDQS